MNVVQCIQPISSFIASGGGQLGISWGQLGTRASLHRGEQIGRLGGTTVHLRFVIQVTAHVPTRSAPVMCARSSLDLAICAALLLGRDGAAAYSPDDESLSH